MKKDVGFYVIISLTSIILLLGASLLYFGSSFTGDALFSFGRTTPIKTPVVSNTQASCVDYGNKVVITIPSTSSTRLKNTFKTKTYYDTCKSTTDLQDFYCKKGKIASISKSCRVYCDKGVCKEYLVNVMDITTEYLTCPTQDDINQFEKDFYIIWPDYRTPGWSAWSTVTIWNDYPYMCDFNTTNPSRLVVYNRLRFLRDIKFSKPLPFTGGKTIYEYITLKGYVNNGPGVPQENKINLTNKPRIVLDLDCDFTSSGNRASSYPNSYVNIWLGPSFSSLVPRYSSGFDPNSKVAPCSPVYNSTNRNYIDKDVLNGYLENPVISTGLMIHEFHHAIAFVGHTAGDYGDDKTIDEMGAWGAEFYFNAWIYLYSTNVDDNTKAVAKEYAFVYLNRIQNKCPSNAELKKVVNQIAGNICP